MNTVNQNAKTIYLNDYKPSYFSIEKIKLEFKLDLIKTQVTNEMFLKADTEGINSNLFLNGENLHLVDVYLDNKKLKLNKDYEVSKIGLTVFPQFENEFVLKIINIINPKENTDLQGLYISGDILCTQNEPEGFRNITYFLDRPDCMTKFTTKIIGSKSDFPIMLSNGNKTAEGDLDGGDHFVVWEDPSLKPSYLFALVAGNLGSIQDNYKTKDNRTIDLQIFCDRGNESKCEFAMDSLKKSMKWDEDRFGLIYDLDIYMIVAVDSFNFGAMENKGLNIFNSAYVLASEESATDADYSGIEGVIGHEYFHNWTGNRVTCRDWFQLTLKEGLTVFRDQEFSGDMNSKIVQRIQDVIKLKNVQFVEDSGPMSHPIKPKKYIEINNFYTSTVYEKGAEVIRMIHTLLGEEGFQKGVNLYFERHDGSAVTTNDFINAMADANNFNFEQFLNWYDYAGTPEITIKDNYDSDKKELVIEISQWCPPTKNQDHKKPFYMPFRIGLLNTNEDFKIETPEYYIKDDVFLINNFDQKLIFSNVKTKPVLSVNRFFSAPVKVHHKLHENDLITILSTDTDQFNRYQASQILAERMINSWVKSDNKSVEENIVSPTYLNALKELLLDPKLDKSVKSYCLILPIINSIAQNHNPINFSKIQKCIDHLQLETAKYLESIILSEFQSATLSDNYVFNKEEVSKRIYRNILLRYLCSLNKNEYFELTYKQFQNATNMNDKYFSMELLSHFKIEQRDKALNEFYNKWKNDPLVICKWLTIQSCSKASDTFEKLKELENNPSFNLNIPNHVRSLWAHFAAKNLVHFHREDGAGYKLLKEKILLMDNINSRVAAGMCSNFRSYKKLPNELQALMKIELLEIHQTKIISKDCFEIIDKILN